MTDLVSAGWLTGWKAISKYIGLDPKTVKKLHAEYHLPVRELPTGTKVALAPELDEWLIRYSSATKKSGSIFP